MPSQSQIQDYYDGFAFQVDLENYRKIKTDAVRQWMQSLLGDRSDLTMLDVGGGGGFFARAFEEFGFGQSTYTDLDKVACEFAEKDMGIARVYCDHVENIKEYVGEETFDFIYCRHVVEHLIDPVALIRICSDLLSDDGVFVLQFPNGQSKEGLLFPRYWWRFLRKIRVSNSWSIYKALVFSLSAKYGWGIDPIRHLWAISGAGIAACFQYDERFSVKINSASLVDAVFSPYWGPSNNWYRFAAMFAGLFCGRLYEGMHLVVEIRRNKL